MTYIVQQFINGITEGGIYALLGLGVTLLWGSLRLMNFAQAQILTWGAFGVAFGINSGLPTVVAIAIGILASVALSLVLDRVVVARMLRRGVREEAFVVATLGFSLVIEQVLQLRTHGVTENFPANKFPQGAVHVSGLVIPELYIIIFGISVVVAFSVMLWLQRSKSGRAFRTVAYSHDVALLLGISPRLMYSVGFVISGALAAVAGLFVAADTNVVSYSMGDPLLLTAFAVLIVGGMGSAPGALIGGMVLGVAEVFVGTYISSAYQPAVTYCAILLLLVVRPTGLLGNKEMARV